MINVPTNLRVLKASRKRPQSGDLFVLGLPDETYLFGRVVSTEAVWTHAVGALPANLVYIYRYRSRVAELPDTAMLRPGDLLVAPIMTNNLPWSRGYFSTLANLPLGPGDVLPRHCFLSVARHRYYDEWGNELSAPIEPVGDHGLHSFRTIDDQVSDAVGIPRVPSDR